jgi:fatty-acyl-CoA synthase
MLGLMQQTPLLISSLLIHAARWHGATEIVSRLVEGPIHRTNWAGIERRAQRLALALERLGVRPDGRVATLAWNTHRHLELYYGVSGSGRVLHTVNPRLFPPQIEYIVRDGGAAVLFFDLTFLPLVEQLAPKLAQIETFVALTDRAHMPPSTLPVLMCYEDLLEAETADYAWPTLDETTASGLCYTSGTTGEPKGALYSHRSTLLHAYSVCATDGLAVSARDTILPAVPLFHVNAWGLPFAAAMAGAKLVMPGPKLDGESLFALVRDEGCNAVAGVPTVWLSFLSYVEQNRDRLELSSLKLRRALVGGSAAPRAMIEAFERAFGAFLLHAWGMTETSPVALYCQLLAKHDDTPGPTRFAIQEKQGRPLFGVDVKITDDQGRELSRDGRSVGDLKIRGPWVIGGYFGHPAGSALDAEGWFHTGDVATIDPDGFVHLTDRSKDVIKSGGEWISSITLENLALGHPAVAEAAVIGVRHPRWDERPLLLVRLKPDAQPSRDEILAYLADKVAKWWLPDDVVFVGELPHTATGKLLKTKLRETYRDHLTALSAACRQPGAANPDCA